MADKLIQTRLPDPLARIFANLARRHKVSVYALARSALRQAMVRDAKLTERELDQITDTDA